MIERQSEPYRRIEINQFCPPEGDILGENTQFSVRTRMVDLQVNTPWGTLDIRKEENPPRYLLRGDPVEIPLDAEDEKAIVVFVRPSRRRNDVNVSQTNLSDGKTLFIEEEMRL